MPVSRFDLRDIPKLAPCLSLIGVIDDGRDFLIRLIGTKLAGEFFGRDPTGLTMSESLRDDEFARRSWHVTREVFRSKRPMLNQPGRTRLRDKEYFKLETVTFPLVDEGGSVVKIASLYDFVLEPDRPE